MTAEIIILGPEECPKDAKFPNLINCTSRSNDWGVAFSPFKMGPVVLYDGAPSYYSQNVENAWQYSKVYKEYLDDNGNITQAYYDWAKHGFDLKAAVRYPKGKGAKPEFSLWNGKRLGYIEARKEIYIPVYKDAMQNVPEFERLKEIYNSVDKMFLWDYDGYNHRRLGMTYQDVVENEERSLGHSFVIAMLLEGEV